MKSRLTFLVANPAYTLAVTIACGFAVLALVISFGHQVDVAHRYGVPGWQAYTAPVFIDGFMVLGRLGQSRRFDATKHRVGRIFMITAAVASLAANILNGTTVGYRVFGALIVTGFLAAEYYATTMRPAPPVISEEEQAAIDTRTRRSEASKRGHAARKARLADVVQAKHARKRSTSSGAPLTAVAS